MCFLDRVMEMPKDTTEAAKKTTRSRRSSSSPDPAHRSEMEDACSYKHKKGSTLSLGSPQSTPVI